MSKNYYVVKSTTCKIGIVLRPLTKAKDLVAKYPNVLSSPEGPYKEKDMAQKVIKDSGYKNIQSVEELIQSLPAPNKKADTPKEAKIQGNTKFNIDGEEFTVTMSSSELEKIFDTYNNAIAFSDGSYKNNKMGCGSIIIAGGATYRDAECYIKEVKDGVSSTTAELTSARLAIAKAVALGCKRLFLCYDCSLIEDAATSKKKSSNQDVMAFKQFFKAMSAIMEIKFIKVKAHSKIILNEEVDKLSKVGREK